PMSFGAAMPPTPTGAGGMAGTRWLLVESTFVCEVTHISSVCDELEQLRITFDLLDDSCRSLPNNVQHKFRLGQHGDMTAVGFEDCCPHALCDEALQFGLDGLILGSHDVPAWLGSPCRSFNLLIEQVRCRRSMRGPDEFLLVLRQITGKGRYAVWFQPNTPIGQFDMREDICGGKIFFWTLCRLFRIWGKHNEVKKSGPTTVRPPGGGVRSSL